jgi:protein phosphatase
MEFEIKTYADTNVGVVRQNNEDAYFTVRIKIFNEENNYETINIITVLDGMGGLDRGELASSITGKTYLLHILKTLFDDNSIELTNNKRDVKYKIPYYQVSITIFGEEKKESYDFTGNIETDSAGNMKGALHNILNMNSDKDKTKDWPEDFKRKLVETLDIDNAIKLSNDKVNSLSEKTGGSVPPGTTLTSGFIYRDIMLVTNIGDSRAFRIKDGKIERITKDHSYVQELVDKNVIDKDEARYHPQKNIITRCIGADKHDKADHFIYRIEKGETFLYSSDGLHDLISDDNIENTINNNKGNLEKISSILIENAIKKGGMDNITLILAEIL